MTDPETTKDLEIRLRDTKLLLKLVVSSVFFVFVIGLAIAWWYVRILAIQGGNLISQQFGETGGALIASGYYASTALISISLVLVVCLLFAVIWNDEINELFEKLDFTRNDAQAILNKLNTLNLEQKPEIKKED